MIKIRKNIWNIKRNLVKDFESLVAKVLVNTPIFLPDFLCIGAPRSGTTWLHSRLSLHSEIYIPKQKEVHFFDEQTEISAEYLIDDIDVQKNYFSRPFDIQREADWRWYYRQFMAGNGKVKGDITPAYSRISEQRVKLIADRIPDLKIIFILREPVARIWSGASFFMQGKYQRSLDSLSLNDLQKWVFNPRRLSSGRYRQIIERWENCYSRQNIHYIFYDDIVREPRNVLEGVCDFLNVSTECLPSDDGDKARVNTGYKKIQIPEDIKKTLLDEYRSDIEYVENKFSRDLSHWKR